MITCAMRLQGITKLLKNVIEAVDARQKQATQTKHSEQP